MYGSKANILGALRAAVRDDAAADDAYQSALAEPDRECALASFAQSVRLHWQAGHDVVTTHVESASVDPAVRAELATPLEARRRGIARLARSLATSMPAPAGAVPASRSVT